MRDHKKRWSVPLWKKIRVWRERKRFEVDLEEEIRIHREMSGEAAFGSVALVMEQSREVWGLAWFETWKQDVRYALRGFRRSPAFVLGVVGAIGLGIGLNTTMFTVFNGYVLRPFAVHDPYGLYGFSWHDKAGRGHSFSVAQYEDLRRSTATFSDVLAYVSFVAQVDGRSLFGGLVSGNYFSTLGVGMMHGRPLLPDDNAAVMVVSYKAWRNKFAGDPDLVGRKVYLRGQPFEVVGITSPGFAGVENLPAGFWVPLQAWSALMEGDDLFGPKQPARLSLIGRLQPGATPESAKAALLPWLRHAAADAAGVSLRLNATPVPLEPDTVLSFIPLFTAFGLVLLIACANVSNMMLARALARRREIAIRISLGAARARLVRQLLTESILLALPAALLGFAIAAATLAGAQRLLFATLPPALGKVVAIEGMDPDWHVFLFAVAASTGAALVFGLLPAVQSTRVQLTAARPARLRNILVVTQVAVCTLLLISTAVVLRSQGRAAAQPVGLDTRGVWDVRVLSRHQQKVIDQLAAEPGVEAVAAAARTPLFGSPRHIQIVPAGRNQRIEVAYNLVSADYFSVFRLSMLRGRSFTPAEAEAEAAVTVVSDSTARRLWPGQDAVGQTIAIASPSSADASSVRVPHFTAVHVIGVTRDVINVGAGNGSEEASLYFPTHAGIYGNESVLVRMKDTRADALARLESVLNRIAPSMASAIIAMDDMVALQLYPFRVTAWVGEFLAGVALLLTVSGIYGVMSYLVSQRTKEIGIRVALGADVGSVVRLVIRQSAWLAGVGAAVGVGLALAIAPVFAHVMEVIRPYDWLPYAATAALLLFGAAAASYAPAKRAVAIDPVRTLRVD